MIRRIIEIDEQKCNGCGACAAACHEGAIGMVNGKAKLMRDDYCDGLGDCLPTCPTGAITFVEREAAAYDEAAVLAAKKHREQTIPCGCPGSAVKGIKRKKTAPAAVAVPGIPASAVARADPAGPGKCTLFSSGEAARCGGLHRLCVCRLSSGIYQGTYYIDRLSQAG